MSEKILIASDSTSDLSPELIDKYGIKIIPLFVNLGGKLFTDGGDITPDDIYEHYEKTGELPKTAAINYSDFETFFKENSADGKKIILFTLSSEFSSTYANAKLAAEEFEGVYVVDSRNLSTGGGLLVLHAAEMAEKGMEAEEIVAVCNEMIPKVDASFIVDDLEFLHKGGRCSALAAFGANLLQLKPCIVVDDGKMSVGKKYRGKFMAVLEKYIAERVGDGANVEQDHVFITHAGCDQDIVDSCVASAKKCMPEANIHVTRAGCTISSHCGRNTLGILFIKK